LNIKAINIVLLRSIFAANIKSTTFGAKPVEPLNLQTQMQKIVLFALLAALCCVSYSCGSRSTPTAQSQAPQAKAEIKALLPRPTGFVNDYANVFDANSKQRLESMLVNLRENANVEFAVVTVDTTNGEPLFDYSLALAREWGLGPKDTSQGGGLVLVLAIKEREWRLQVSRSLEKALPDEVCKELGDKSKEMYKQGRYVEGIEKYVKAIINRLESQKGLAE
jgi:uncharacterized protein